MTPEARKAIRRVHAAEQHGVTSPMSRHVRMVGEALLRHGHDPSIYDDAENVGLSLLALVEAHLRRERQIRAWAERHPDIARTLEREQAAHERAITAWMEQQK